MAAEPITYLNRYTGRVETEEVYGGGFLQWVYGNPLGRLSLHALVKRAAFSRWYGWRMNRAGSKRKVAPFIANYKVDVSEFAEAPETFRSFNEFFYRKLKPEARPVAGTDNVAVFPADARHLGFQDISRIEGIFVKGEVFDLATLLQDATLAERFGQGSLVMSRLCPLDYHRFHFPVSGTPAAPKILDGPLFSVSPIALRRNIHILARNRRALSEIRSGQFGLVLMLEIGATNVGSFAYTYTPGKPVRKGDEKGYFKFGGSSLMTLFEPGRIMLDQDLLDVSKQGRELYARVGDHMGQARGASETR